MSRTRFPVPLAVFTTLVAGALVASAAQAAAPPVRIDYEAVEGCPGVAIFVDEIHWRTSLVQLANPGEDALAVRARITEQDGIYSGNLGLSLGDEETHRSAVSSSCDEVVSALAFITAVRIDPAASRGPRPHPPPVPGARAILPPSAAPTLSRPLSWHAPPSILALPLPALISSSSSPRVPPPPDLVIGATATTAFAVTPRPLYSGGLFVEHAFAARWGGALRVTVEVGATGRVDVSQVGATFARDLIRIEPCLFSWHLARRLSIVPCLAVEGGLIHSQGVGPKLPTVDNVTVPWFGAGLLPRITLDLDRIVVDVRGGAIFPLLRRGFGLNPAPVQVIYELPAVTGMVALSMTVRFP